MHELTGRDLELTAELISAIDSPLRLRILLLLDKEPHVVHQLVSKLNKSQPLISQHLRVLKQSKLVDATRSGREVIYSLAQPGIIDIICELVELGAGTLDDRTYDELASRRRLLARREQPRVVESGVALIEPRNGSRPEPDPGLTPKTSGPIHE